MTLNTLPINFNDEPVGVIGIRDSKFFVEYQESWVETGFALSPFIPLDGAGSSLSIEYFLSNLFPEGDPLDVLVVTPHPVAPGAVIRARPVGVLHMTDDGGGDAKLIAVPHDKLTVLYRDIKEYTDLPELLIQQIQHFFENYKDLEAGKWVKIDRWGNAEEARAEIVKAVNAYQK